MADGEPGRAGGVTGAKMGAPSAPRGDDQSMRSGLVRNASTFGQEAEWDMAPVMAEVMAPGVASCKSGVVLSVTRI